VKQCETDIKRLTDSLNLRYAEMPEPYRSMISAQLPQEWPSTTYPERDDLAHLRREVAQLEAMRRAVREAEAIASKATDYRGKLEQAQSTMTTLRAKLPKGELANLRQEHSTLQARERSLLNNIKAAKRAIEDADRRVDTLGAEAHAADQNLARISGELQTEQVKQEHGAQDVAKALATLPEAWRTLVQPAGLGEYAAWKAELQELQERGTEARAKQLEMARSGLNTIRLEIESLQVEVDAFPDEAKKPPEAIRAQIAEARKMLDAHDVALREVERSREKLLGYREARVQLNQRYTELDGAHNKYKILAELLGRDRLQRHLVRQAERQIVDYGNSVLDRLSGGQLYLKLIGGDDSTGTDRALDLECFNRTTGGAPINVTFLSGSQRFRVAVSLALAIGQYASKQHRPIESVIIDEGFGCLDRQGRQVMIQELQNLRGHLHCILLVSHQEEFADAFADGYRFELQDGATQVSRFQR